MQASIINSVAFRTIFDGVVAEIADLALVLSVISKRAGVAGVVSGVADSAVNDEVGAGHALVVEEDEASSAG